MGFTALQMLWLLPAFTFTTQELVKLKLNPRIIAECDKQVTLNCNTFSSQEGLSIKHMEWSQDITSLCSVDSEGTITTHHRNAASDFRCEYENGQLSLIFQKVQPLESGQDKPYRCKLRSNQGVTHGYTRVELQECSGKVEGVLENDGASCTFNHVYPDGDVHWFHGSLNLSDGSLQQNTTKRVDEQGWLTIHSHLKRKSPHVAYNCSLKSTLSGRYIASTSVRRNTKAWRPTPSATYTNGVRSQESTPTVLFILIMLAVME